MDIKDTYTVINRMQADGVIARYAVGGAIGATFYLEPAQTYDVDVFVILRPKAGQLLVNLEDIHSYLETLGCQVDRQGYSVIGGYPVQFLPADSPLLAEALERSMEHDYEGVPVQVFAAEYLAAIALSVNRGKDKIRLQQFRESEDFPVREFFEIIERHGLGDRWQRFLEQMES
jgi:hypothetical protein